MRFLNEKRKSTQLAYPSLAQLDRFNATPIPPNLLDGLKLVGEPKKEGELHHMRDGAVVLYRRDRSKVWQVRFKLFDSRWHRFSTKRIELAYNLRHTYAKMELLSGTDIKTVARQMGTSVLMLERHYSKKQPLWLPSN